MANMGKMVVLVLGLEILLLVAGLPTGTSSVLNAIGIDIKTGADIIASDFDNLDAGSLNTIILGIIIGATAVGIGIGFLTKSSPIEYLLVPAATLFVAFSITIGSLIIFSLKTYPIWVGVVVLLILLPVWVMYLLSVLNWWSNRQ